MKYTNDIGSYAADWLQALAVSILRLSWEQDYWTHAEGETVSDIHQLNHHTILPAASMLSWSIVQV